MEELGSAVHQAQMEHGRDEGWTVFERGLEVVYGVSDTLLLLIVIVVLLIEHGVPRDVLSLCLEAKSLCVIELGIDLLSIDGILKFRMRLIKLRLVQVDVSQVEVVVRVVFVVVDGDLVLLHRQLHVALVVVSKTQVLVVERQVGVLACLLAFLFFCLELNCVLIGREGTFKVLSLKL